MTDEQPMGTIACPECYGMKADAVREQMPEHVRAPECNTCSGSGEVAIPMDVFALLQEILNTANNVTRGCLQVSVTAGMLYHDEEADVGGLLESLRTLQSCYQATEDVRLQMIMTSSLDDDEADEEAGTSD